MRSQCSSEGLSAPVVDGREPVWTLYTLSTGLCGNRFTTLDPSGNILVAQSCGSHVITRVAPNTGVTTLVAGSMAGYANGAPLASKFNGPLGIACSPSSGDIYVSESANQAIRVISVGGVSLLTGTPGVCGNVDSVFNPSTGAWTASKLCNPGPLTLSLDGYLYVADGDASYRFRIRRVDVTTGAATFLVGDGSRRYMPCACGCEPTGPYPLGHNDITTVAGKGWVYQDITDLTSHPLYPNTTYVTSGRFGCSGSITYISVLTNFPNPANGTVGSVVYTWSNQPTRGTAEGQEYTFDAFTNTCVHPVTGAIVVVDNENSEVRLLESTGGGRRGLITSGGTVSTLAGGGWAGFVDGTPGKLSGPRGCVVSRAPGYQVYVIDNSTVRVIEYAPCLLSSYCPSPLFGVQCPKGAWCNGTSTFYPCLPGTYSSELSATSNATCRVCPAGNFCLAASAYPYPCPPGRYNSLVGSMDACACMVCSALPGYGCGVGSTLPTGVVCPIGSFCGGGSSPPTICDCPGVCASKGLVSEPFAWTVWGVSTIAGTGVGGTADGDSAKATFSSSMVRIAVDTYNGDTVFVADQGSMSPINIKYPSAVRMINQSSNTVSTFAGGQCENWVDGTSACFKYAQGVAVVGQSGSLLVTDTDGAWNSFLRPVSPNGYVSTLVSYRLSSLVSIQGASHVARFNYAWAARVDLNNTIYVLDRTAKCVRAVNWTGSVSTIGCSGNNVDWLAVDVYGNLFVTDFSSCRVFKVSRETGAFTLLAGTGTLRWGDGQGGKASFGHPYGLASNSADALFVADNWSNTLKRVSYSGAVTTILGSGGPFFADGLSRFASLNDLQDVAVGSDGALYILDSGNRRVRKAQCNVCPGGLFCANYVAYTCPGGYFCPWNSTTPTPCPQFTFSLPGSVSLNDCLTCTLGSYCISGGARALTLAQSWDLPREVKGVTTVQVTPTKSDDAPIHRVTEFLAATILHGAFPF